jgi:hypothetical protein
MSSGLFATPTPTAFGIPQSDGSGFIDPNWLLRGNFSSPAIFQQTDGTGAVLGTGVALTLSTQAAALVWAGPVSGAAAAPTFRALTTTDIPSLSGIYQPLNAKLTSISALANAVGWLHNDGAGNFIYSTPPGGVGANPTALLGLTAINGVATTFLRSDGAPALNQAISPIWSGNHTFQNLVIEKAAAINGTAGGGFLTLVGQSANPTSPAAGTLLLHSSTKNGFTRLEQDNEAATNLVYGRDNVFVARNDTGVTILKGRAVFNSGTAAGAPQITLARANSGATLPALGVALDDIPTGTFGQVMTVGLISFDTTAFSDIDSVWVSATTAGLLTRIRPSGTTNFVQRMGTILVSGVAGVGLMLVDTAPAVLNQETGTNAATWTGRAIVGDSLVLNATPLSPIYGGTGLATIANGKMLYASALNTFAALSTGNSLAITGGVLDTIQDIRTSAAPQFAAVGIALGTHPQNAQLVMPGAAGSYMRFGNFGGDVSMINYFNFAQNNTDGAGEISCYTSGVGYIPIRIGLGGSPVEFGSTIKTAAPSGGTAQPWKLGGYTTGVAIQAGKVRVEINGTPYDLLTA